jgi:hypothetical protein
MRFINGVYQPVEPPPPKLSWLQQKEADTWVKFKSEWEKDRDGRKTQLAEDLKALEQKTGPSWNRNTKDEMDRFDRVGTGASEAWKARMQAYDRPGFMDQFSRESYRQPPRKLVKRKVAVDESGMSKKEKKKAARERKKADKAEKKAEAKRAKDKAEVRLKAMGLHVHKG